MQKKNNCKVILDTLDSSGNMITDFITNYDCLKLINNIEGESSWFGNIYKNNKLKKRNTFIYSSP